MSFEANLGSVIPYILYMQKNTATPKDCGRYSVSGSEPYCLLLRFRYLIIAIISQQNRIAGIKPKMRSMISVVAILPINKFSIVS